MPYRERNQNKRCPQPKFAFAYLICGAGKVLTTSLNNHGREQHQADKSYLINPLFDFLFDVAPHH